MFSKQITNSSQFLMMSQSAQSLYLHLGMNADDDGICEVFTVMRMTESKPDDLKSLHDKGFIYVVDSKVCIVKDWHENNQLRGDRYKASKYFDNDRIAEIYAIVMKEKIAKISQYKGLLEKWQPKVAKMAPQYRIGKSSKGKSSSNTTKRAKPVRFEKGVENVGCLPETTDSQQITEVLDVFRKLNPALNFGNKTFRSAIVDLIDKIGFEQTLKAAQYAVSIQGTPYAPVIANPYQLSYKFGELVGFRAKQVSGPKTIAL